MATKTAFAAIIAAAVALGWWLLRRRSPTPDMEPPPPEFPPRWEGLINYTSHALRRRRERCITDENVRDVLGNPISVEPKNRKGKWRVELHGRTDVRTLRVIVKDWPAEPPQIITAYWLDKEVIEVPTKRLGALFGPSGQTIKRIQSESGTRVVVRNDRSGDLTRVSIHSPFEWEREAAKATIGAVAQVQK